MGCAIIPSVLFRLPEYEFAARSVTFVAVHELARGQPIARGDSSLVGRPRAPDAVNAESGDSLKLAPIAVKAALEMDIRRVVAGEVDEVTVAMIGVAEQEAKALVRGLIERLMQLGRPSMRTVGR